MTAPFKIMCLSIALVALPALAAVDPHAGHHPASKATAPATTAPPSADAAKPHCPMMETRTPAAGGTQPQSGTPMQGARGQGMMGGEMPPEMMKACMDKESVAPADQQHGN